MSGFVRSGAGSIRDVCQASGWESGIIHNLLPMASGLFAIPELGDRQGLCLLSRWRILQSAELLGADWDFRREDDCVLAHGPQQAWAHGPPPAGWPSSTAKLIPVFPLQSPAGEPASSMLWGTPQTWGTSGMIILQMKEVREHNEKHFSTAQDKLGRATVTRRAGWMGRR